MRILFILEYYHPHIGGVETLFKLLTQELESRGHQVTVLTNRYDRDLPRFESSGGLSIHRVSFHNRYIFTFLAWIPALKLARSADIIHTTSYNAAFPAWVAAKLRGKKSLITFHELWGRLWFELPWIGKFSALLHFVMEWSIAKLSFDKVVGVSDYTKRALIRAGIEENKVVRIYNGMEYSSAPQKKPLLPLNDTFTMTFFGRLGYSKGIDILIKGAGLLAKRQVDFELNLITSPGPAFLLKKVKALIKGEQVEQQVNLFFEMKKSDLEQMILKSSAVVIPSYSEGFCFAAAETMALGVPIISSGRGALAEVLSGYFTVAEEFSPEGLAEAMQRAFVGEWEYKPPRRFEVADTINAYIDLYESL